MELGERNYGLVKILEPHKCKDFNGERKRANLTLFKLVRRGGYMFKVGDIVRCKTNRYGITTYKRPCEVVEILSDEKINVRCLERDGSTYDVDTDIF